MKRVHGARVWDSMRCPEKQVCQFKDQLLRRVSAWITHPLGSSLASKTHSQVPDVGNHCPEGCVLVKHCAGSREKRHVHCGPSVLRLLTQASRPGGSLLSITALRGVRFWNSVLLCKYVDVLFYTFSLLFQNLVFGRLLHLFQTFEFSLIYRM